MLNIHLLARIDTMSQAVTLEIFSDYV